MLFSSSQGYVLATLLTRAHLHKNVTLANTKEHVALEETSTGNETQSSVPDNSHVKNAQLENMKHQSLSQEGLSAGHIMEEQERTGSFLVT